ncbi:MAG TPA: hypothetical protein VFN55_13880 [Solirubrobacteraceae bacterium]|nr:hypothetical protein [Solirubrobacteraceae bacterium]
MTNRKPSANGGAGTAGVAGAGPAGGRPAVAGGATAQPEMERRIRAERGEAIGRGQISEAFLPYLIVSIVVGVISLNSVAKTLTKATTTFAWPGLHILGASGKPPKSEMFKLDWFTAAGTGLIIAGLITMVLLRIRPGWRCAPTCAPWARSSGRCSLCARCWPSPT